MWTRIGSQRLLHSLQSFAMTLVAAIFLFSSNVLAEDINFEAVVSSNKISLQDMLELTLTLHGAKGNVSAITMPSVEGFDMRYVGPATKFTIINGASFSERSFVYNLFPSKIGHFQIPSVPITVEGKIYKTSPINIEVLEKPVESSAEEESEVSKDLSIYDKVFMKAAIDPKEVFLGEQVPLTMHVYVNGLSLQLAAAPAVKPDGFVADATANMQKSKQIINGINYDSLIFDTHIYPTRPGALTIGPFQAAGELVYRVKQSHDLLSELFASTESRPITLTAPAISLNVLPLPVQGQPANFSGAVGQYDFKANVGPASVKVGDPLTLHMTITGQGRIKDLKAPVLSDSRFKIYDPQIKDNDHSRTMDQVIIPISQDITEVSAISFSYFDPKEKKYKTITQGPFPVKVIAPAVGEEFKAYGFIDKTKTTVDKPTVLGTQGIKNLLERSVVRVKGIMTDWRFWGLIILLGAVWTCWTMWKEFQNRLQKDEAFAREWKADAKAKVLLKSTKEYLQKGNIKEFYSSLYKTLNDYLADKMHVPVAALTWGMIEDYLIQRSVDSSKLAILKELFERCDLARFASATIPSEQMAKDFWQLEDLVQYLPKILK